MGFRDPRVLSDKLDNNAVNVLAAVPAATSTPESDQVGNDSSYTGGYVAAQRLNPLAPAPEAEEVVYYGVGEPVSVQYPAGPLVNNITRGPDERDSALDAGKGLLNAKGYSSGKI